VPGESNHPAVLVTGATGFIGRRLVDALRERDSVVHVLVRHGSRARRTPWPANTVIECHGDLGRPQTLDGVCAGIETVFHLAGYSGPESDDAGEGAHWQVTVAGTRVLLTQAQQAGVRRFVFVSSVKAMGEGGATRLDESSPAVPISPYGRAKLEAEKLVLDAGKEHGMHVCVLRLPLVYGRDNQGNIPRMIAAIDHGRFPPLPEVHNKRSMVHVDDAIEALLLSAKKEEARNKVYIVTDDQAYSTHQIYELICNALGRRAARTAVPVPIWKIGARIGDLVGRIRGKPFVFNSEKLDKLFGSAWYSSDKIRRELGFNSKHTLETALPEIVADYHNGKAVRRGHESQDD